ncbi:MAG: tripartite tricarboxylate transporter substrate-binding protein [Burkholderiales bacterium]
MDFSCSTPPAARPFVESGAITAIAIGGENRSALLPNVPTASEAKLAGFDLNAWQGLFAPKGTPPAIIAKINAAVAEAQQDAAVQKQYIDLGFAIPAERSAEGFARLMAANTARWVPILKAMDLPRE